MTDSRRVDTETARENGTCDACGYKGWVGYLFDEWLCLDCGLGAGIEGLGAVEYNSGGGHIILDKHGKPL